MKTYFSPTIINAWAILFLALCVFTGGFCQAQTLPVAVQHADGDYAVVQRGPHSRLWRNSAGQSVTEITTGLNHWNGTDWVPSDPSFAVSPAGTAFVADNIQDPTRLAANLNVAGAVTVTTPHNVTLHSTPLAVGLYDAASGKSVIVATLGNSAGVLADPQHVVYEKAFVGGGFAASVVYALPDTGSFHQDVIFTGFNQPFDPSVWGFAANSISTLQVQIWTEFYDPPLPRMVERPLYIEKDPSVRASMVSPDLIDYTLDFGDYVFGPGRAYGQERTGLTAPRAGGTIAKDFVTSGGRTFLIESIPFVQLQSMLQGLPPVATKTGSLAPPRAKKTRLAALDVPKPKEISKADMDKIVPAKTSAVALALPKGITADYVVTVGSSTTPVVFSADTTYYLSGNVYEYAPVTFESAVFKSPIYSGIIWCYDSVTTATTNYRPAIFTAADDNTVGAALSTSIWSGYTGIPWTNGYGLTPVWLYAATNASVNNLEFRYLWNGIAAGYGSSDQVITVSDCQFVNCRCGTTFETGAPLTHNLNNCLMANVAYPVESHSFTMTVNAVNCTFDSAFDLFSADGSWSSTSSFNMTNCILSDVTNEFAVESSSLFASNGAYNGFYNASEIGASPSTNTSSPYQANGAASYYLADNSPWRSLGTTNIVPTVLAEIQSLTTYPPFDVPVGWFTNDATFFPQAQRDAGPAIALGYHYPPIDYAISMAISNAAVTVLPGTVLAGCGQQYGVWLYSNATFNCQGTATSPVYFVRYNTVQEQSNTNWESTSLAWNALLMTPNCLDSSSANFAFTDWSVVSGDGHIDNLDFPLPVVLAMENCQFYQGSIDLMEVGASVTNCLFRRVNTRAADGGFAISQTFFNNLFVDGELVVGHTGSGQYTFRDNFFDQTTISTNSRGGTHAIDVCSTNGYVTTTNGVLMPENNDVILSSEPAWQVGALGQYYYPTNFEPTNLSLIFAGSRTAAAAGLYQYTVLTNFNTIEGTNMVSIGFHYVGVGTNGLPIDTDANGIPNYLLDVNGTGVVASGEIDWQVPGDLGLTVVITRPANNSIVP
jgi:hypothetical protein